MDKQGAKLKKHNRVRLIFMACYTAVTNGYIMGFVEGKIYTGPLKKVCVPGLNCYSCPGALGACPIGSLQSALSSHQYTMALYVIGFLTVFGAFMGRFVCGFLCPFGLIQELLNKIPFVKKIRKLPGEKYLRWLKYVILAVFVILLPLVVVDITGTGDPWFCKYICPSGTLLGGIPNILLNSGLRSAAGFLFEWKVTILVVAALVSIIIYRPFCRYLCPLGAVYSLFNKVSIYRYTVNEDKCVSCGICQKTCGFDIKVWQDPNSFDCIRCGNCRAACPKSAIELVKPFGAKETSSEAAMK